MIQTFKNRLGEVFYSFPVQLLVLHLRSNLLLLGLWLVLAMFVTGKLGKSFGLRFLFLNPEYLGEVSWLSFFIIGFTFGALIISWNLTTYLLSTHHFPFLATLKRPFTKFCLNNAIIPLAFFFMYVGYVVYFQIYYELQLDWFVLIELLSFILGMLIAFGLTSLYLQFTNKDISNFEKRFEKRMPPNKVKTLAPGPRGIDIEMIKKDDDRWRVDTYLSESLSPRTVRSVAHYDSKFLLRIFKQNHLNTFYLMFGILVFLMILGYLMDYKIFRIPAGGSIFIISSIVIAVVGAVNYWLHRWRFTLLILFLIIINSITRSDYFNHQNKAYGLNYKSEQTEYSFKRLKKMATPEKIYTDQDSTRMILDNWRAKFGKKKPKMIITSVSGGGLKAALWTMNVLQNIDSTMNCKFMDHTALMTGASGGMIGTSYYRSLHLEKENGIKTNPNHPKHLKNMGKDLLNSIAFSIISNDLFLPWTKFKYNDHAYIRDRGYMFEKQLNENTEYVLDKPLGYYKEAEFEAKVPMVVISPSIVNDARRLLISPQGVSYLTTPNHKVDNVTGSEIDAVDFRSIFGDLEADKLRFTTALRMNATYPYILPNVHLPSEPQIEVMDAGFRDNMGLLTCSRFIQTFKNWILENTSGVILVQISTMDHGTEIPPSDDKGVIESFFNPLGIFSHILRLQDFEHDANLSFLYDILGGDYFEVIRFNYRPSPENEAASMTFHLTSREKKDILNSITLPVNKQSLEKIKAAMGMSKHEHATQKVRN